MSHMHSNPTYSYRHSNPKTCTHRHFGPKSYLMISQFIILSIIPTNNLSFPLVYTTQGNVPPSLLCSSPRLYHFPQGPNIDRLGSLRDVASGILAATTFTICQFPQQFQPTCSHSPQPSQPNEVYPILYTTSLQDVPLPSRAPTQGQIGSLRVVALGTPTMIMESPNFQIVVNVLPTLHP
jgi:hypothetical protein